jgi:hypothetical protein
LLEHVPGKVIGQLYSLAKTGATEEDGKKVIRDAISSVLTVARDNVVKNLRKQPRQERASEASN